MESTFKCRSQSLKMHLTRHIYLLWKWRKVHLGQDCHSPPRGWVRKGVTLLTGSQWGKSSKVVRLPVWGLVALSPFKPAANPPLWRLLNCGRGWKYFLREMPLHRGRFQKESSLPETAGGKATGEKYMEKKHWGKQFKEAKGLPYWTHAASFFTATLCMARAAITRGRRLAGLNSGDLFLRFGGLQCEIQVLQSQFLLRAVKKECVPGISPWPINGHLTPVFSHGFLSVHVCVLISSPYKDTRQNGLEPTLNELYEEPISKYSHTRARASAYVFGEVGQSSTLNAY